MRKFILALSVFLFSMCVFADTISLQNSGEKTGFTIVSDEVKSRIAPRLLVKCTIAELETSVVSTAKGQFTQIAIPGYQLVNEPGNPAVPVMHQMVQVPFGAQLDVQVISKLEKEYRLEELGILHPITPCQPSHRKDQSEFPFAYNEAAYQKNEYADTALAQVREVGVLRNYRIAGLEIAPVLYNPVEKKIKVYYDIYLEISLKQSDLAQTAEMQRQYHSPYFAWVENRLLVPASLKARDGSSGPVGYAIVSDRLFADDLKPFVDLKTAQGYHVEVAYTDQIGATKEAIQKYLHNLYKNPTPEKPAPTFVLLVGDLEQIPAFSGTAGSYVTDLYYVAVTDDKIPEMYCGRFSAKTHEDIVAQVEKTVEYAQYRMPDPSYLKNSVLIAGWDASHAVEWGYPQINYAAKYYFNEEHGIGNTRKFLSAGSNQNVSAIRNLISQGACVVNYTAHGSATNWSDPSLTKSDIAGIPTNHCYALLIGNCCLTNKFDVDVCFGEAWLRAKHKGGIGYIGGSSYTYWDEDLWWGDGLYPIAHPNSQGLPPDKGQTKHGAYDGVFENGYFSNGSLMLAGNLAVQESTSNLKVYYWEVYHLMGDPSLIVYCGVPKPMAVKYPAAVKIGATAIDVEAEADAYVGIAMNGKLYGAGAVDKAGKATIKIQPFTQTGTAVITVTRQNREPYVQNIRIVE